MLELNEVLNDDTLVYPAIDLKPKAKIPQLWNIKAPGNDTFALRLVSHSSEGDSVKNVKQGDKMVSAFILSVKENGAMAKLQGGFGSDPYGVFATCFELVWDVVKRHKMDAVMFRIPIKQVKGQIKGIQRIISRLVMRRTGGQFTILEELQEHNQKYAFIFIYRKSRNLEDIPGIPKINKDEWFISKVAGTEVYLDKKSGEEVSKAEVMAQTIANKSTKISDQVVASKSKLSRVELARTQNAMFFDKTTEENMNDLIELNKTVPMYSPRGRETSKMEKDAKPVDLKSFGFDVDKGLSKLRNVSTNFGTLPNRQMPVGNLVKWIDRVKKYQDAPLRVQASVEAIKDIVQAGIEEGVFYGPDSSPWDQEKAIRNFLQEYMLLIKKSYAASAMMMTRKDSLQGAPASVQSRVQAYTTNWFAEANQILQGKGFVKNQKQQIKEMDKAFEYGSRLAKGTTLWRGQKLNAKIWESSIENKVFYFVNYVSCSLYPIIFGHFGEVSSAFTGYKSDDENNPGQQNLADIDAGDAVPLLRSNIDYVRIGFAISGAEKISVIVPGEHSEFEDECEVILPRGVAVQFNKIHYGPSEYGSKKDSAIVECTLIAPDQLDESVEMYDGDALFETGEVKKIGGFAQFLGESIKTSDKRTWEMIVNSMSDNIPAKFSE